MDNYGNMRLKLSENIFKIIVLTFNGYQSFDKHNNNINIKYERDALVVTGDKWKFSIEKSLDGLAYYIVCTNTHNADVNVNIGEIIPMQYGDIISATSESGGNWKCAITGFEWPVT